MEGRLGRWSLVGRRRFWLPDAPLHISQHMAELLFCFLSGPAFCRRTECDITAPPVGPESDRPSSSVLGINDAAAGFAGHQQSPPSAMNGRRQIEVFRGAAAMPHSIGSLSAMRSHVSLWSGSRLALARRREPLMFHRRYTRSWTAATLIVDESGEGTSCAEWPAADAAADSREWSSRVAFEGLAPPSLDRIEAEPWDHRRVAQRRARRRAGRRNRDLRRTGARSPRRRPVQRRTAAL
jgi:hypothetical protein